MIFELSYIVRGSLISMFLYGTIVLVCKKYKIPSFIDDDAYFDYRPSADDSIDIILNCIDSILTSEKEIASLLLIPPYEK